MTSKRIPVLLCVLAVSALMLVASRASAQGVTSATSVQNQTSDSAAVNSGVSTTFNSYGTPMSIIDSNGRQSLHTNQAATAGPAFSSPAVQGTCATAGWGIAGQAVSGGLAFAGPGGVDAGCDLVRDLSIMKEVGATRDEALARVCMKAEIAKALGAKCQPKQATAARGEPSDPYVRSRLGLPSLN